MTWIQRLLGLDDGAVAPGAAASTESIRQIEARLRGLEPDHAQLMAGFAYVLARVAAADLTVSNEEMETMERLVGDAAGLEPAEARLVVEVAGVQARERGATDDYLVTRELCRIASRDDRIRLVDCAFAVAAADGSISGSESEQAVAIAKELGFSPSEAAGMKARWREHLAELQDWPPKR